MSVDDREPVVADPESVAPEPVHVPDEQHAAVAAEPPVEAAKGAFLFSALIPGAGQIMSGAWARGMTILFAWGVLLAIVLLAWDRIVGVREHGSTDDWVALAALVGSLIAVYIASISDLRRRARTDDTGDSQWSIASRHFRRNRLAIAGLAVLALLYLVALLAPFLAPYDPIAQEDILRTSYLSPSAQHWMGTDRFGRDVFSRILYGARISLAIGFVATALSVSLGTLLGAVAGYFGGKVDTIIMRFTDMVLAFPRLVLLIMIVALFSPSVTLIILVLGLTQWPGTTRIVRGEVLSLREREYVQAARSLGFGSGRIVMRHLIPNVLAPVIVTATLGIGNTIVMEAGLSFLGLGVQPPTASWGNLVADGRQNLLGAWWVATFPGLAIVVTVLAFNLVGDGLRDALDPRLRT